MERYRISADSAVYYMTFTVVGWLPLFVRWQPSKHSELVFSEQFLTAKLTYLHNNPVRAGLVRQSEHRRFSSAGYYGSDGNEDCDVEVTSLWW